MNMNFNFLGKCDISHIRDKIINISDDIWDEYTYRQNQYDVHSETKSINVKFSEESSEKGIEPAKTKYYDFFDFEKLINKIHPIYEKNYGNGYFQRILIVKLPKYKSIKMHTDDSYGLVICKRTHIPILTHKNTLFIVENETKNLAEGEIWEIDNTKPHAVYNQTETDRIHLILDYMPYDVNLRTKRII